MSIEIAQWARTHTFGGRVVGEYLDATQTPPRPMVVLQTLSGPEIAPRDALIPLDPEDVVGSLAQRLADVLDAAARVGYSPDEMRQATEQALRLAGR
jgi:hypothetical protein